MLSEYVDWGPEVGVPRRVHDEECNVEYKQVPVFCLCLRRYMTHWTMVRSAKTFRCSRSALE